MAESKLLEFGNMSPGVIVKGVTIVLTAMCNCGSPEPVTIPFIHTGRLTTSCARCGAKFFLGRLNFDAENPDGFKVGVGVVPAAIVRPPAGFDARS
jgi:hypothetical protein